MKPPIGGLLATELNMQTTGYLRQVVDESARVRLPELFDRAPRGALYYLPDRHGVSVLAVSTKDLPQEQLTGLLCFRLAQYLEVGFVDGAMVHEARMRQEPQSVVSPDDIHLVAGLRATGEVLAYSVIEAPPAAPRGTRLRSIERPLFPVEHVHGFGIYNRLPILPDLPIDRVRELGRFVKKRRQDASREHAMRAVVEIGVAMFRVLTGVLRMHVDAVIGDLEESAAKQNLEFFHVPMVVIHGTVPYEGAASYLHPRYERHAVYPFACLTSDAASALPRLDAIEMALARPGKLAMLSLLGLKGSRGDAPSMLVQPDRPARLAELAFEQKLSDMPARHQLLDTGARLRTTRPFTSLSVAEAALLGTLMEPIDVTSGQLILRQGEPNDALYLIEQGDAEVWVRDEAGGRHLLGSLGPGACCGEVSLLTDSESIADVRARTPMTLLRLTKRDYETHLVGLTEVDQELSHAALNQVVGIDRELRRVLLERRSEHNCGCGDGCGCSQPAAPENQGARAPAMTNGGV